MRWMTCLSLAACLCGCGPDKPEGPIEHPLRIGAVMVETGHRFETSGRAATAGRWGLAAYEAEELLELFEADMSRAPLPGDCNDTVSDAMYMQLIEEQLPALRAAAEREDRDAYAAAFRTGVELVQRLPRRLPRPLRRGARRARRRGAPHRRARVNGAGRPEPC